MGFAKQGDDRHAARKDKPPLKLVGVVDSNAFSILAAAKKAAEKYGWTSDEWEAVKSKAMKGNYDHLLATIQDAFDVEGEDEDEPPGYDDEDEEE